MSVANSRDRPGTSCFVTGREDVYIKMLQASSVKDTKSEELIVDCL